VGDLLYAATTTTFAKLSDVATGNALISGGVSTAPAWGKIGLTTHVSGVLPIANGGTNGSATPTAYGIAYGTGTTYSFTAAGTAKQVLIANTGSAPTWSTLTSGSSILYGDGSGGLATSLSEPAFLLWGELCPRRALVAQSLPLPAHHPLYLRVAQRQLSAWLRLMEIR
jgi:hypothetical protein